MKKKGIITGVVIGISYIIEQQILAYLQIPYLIFSSVILFIAIAPVSIVIFKYMLEHNLSIELATMIGATAYITCTTLLLLEILLTKDYTISGIAGLAFFSLLFGFVFSAISASLFVKGNISTGR